MLPGFRVSSRDPRPGIGSGYMQGISHLARTGEIAKWAVRRKSLGFGAAFVVRRRIFSLLNLAGAVVLVIRNHGAFFNLI